VAGTTTGSVSLARQSLAQQFDTLRTQIDQAVKDAGYSGVNLLDGGSLALATNETGTSKFTLAGAQITAAGLGLAAATNQFQTDTDVNTAIANVSRAVTALSAHSTVLASNMDVVKARRDFTKSIVDTLKAGADELLLADTSEDSALLLALQTREQIAATALSMAHGSDQTALRLFRF
jgi:flagellin